MTTLRDFRVFVAPETFVAVLLSRVVTFEHGGEATAFFLQEFPKEDLRYLEGLYRQLNGYSVDTVLPS